MSVQWDGNLIERITEISEIPLQMLIRNAARDFARAGFYATPVAKKIPEPGYFELWSTPNGWRKFVKKKGQWQKNENAGDFIRYLPFSPGMVTGKGKPKSKYVKKHTYGRGWSKASWFGIFKSLGMDNLAKARTQAARNNASTSEFGDQMNPGYELTVGIEFTKRPGATEKIYAAGYARAAKNLMKTYETELKKKWQA